MKKKVVAILIGCLFCSCLVGCDDNRDRIEIYNRRPDVLDDICIEIKEGYFYDKHEKFTVDENTVGVTIYFSNDDAEWD